MTVEIIAGVCALIAIAIIVVPATITGAPPMPTSRPVWQAMETILPARVSGPIVDLGSGWGGLAIRLARKYPSRHVTGYEISPLPWLVATLRVRLRGPANVTFRLADARRADLTAVALIAVFLNREALTRLKPVLERHAATDAWVVANFFAIQDWRPVAQTTAADMHRSPVYLYKIRDTGLAAASPTP